MVYLLAFAGILLYSLLRFIIIQASRFGIAALGVWYLLTGKMPEIGAILLLGGIVIAIMLHNRKGANLPYKVTQKKITRGGGL